MKNDKMPTLVEVPRVGSEYIKLKTGELVEWQSFDEITQIFEIKSPNGETLKVHRRDTEVPTSNEELDFLLSKQRTH
ncbi:MAG TPA: hypothetical protein VN784_01100 [Candidatus Limnocylindrales bacterium]|nr:hypothetical protein [Candidatus Limnocylindrales bacterium]